MSSEVFEYKEDELCILFDSIRRKCKDDLPKFQGGKLLLPSQTSTKPSSVL